ncbi:MAG: hypothetical protein K2K46_01470 [Lachnospiraceae bacterium]|nr:hypothetical protein [Lachnospiraceae bacterium]
MIIVESLGVAGVIIGIGGISGAIENEGAGLLQSVMLLAAGALILYTAYRTGSWREKERC